LTNEEAPEQTAKPAESPPATGEIIDQTSNEVPEKSSMPPDYIRKTTFPGGLASGEQ